MSPLCFFYRNFHPTYLDLLELFSKAKASGLPLNCPYDCVIELVPGSIPPHNRIHPLSMNKQKAMEEYIREALQQGYIHPSCSVSVFCGEGGGLWSCIDYRGLNQITV